MSEFKDVTVVREANIYFNGAVASHTILFGDGTKKTLGIMQPGEYTFNTGAPELMEIFPANWTCNWRVKTAGAESVVANPLRCQPTHLLP